MINLHLLYNKTYYSHLGQEDFEESLTRYNKQMFDSVFDHHRDYKPSPLATHTLILETAYPGMMVGSGNPHGGNLSESDMKNGFTFDYVTGQPVIPGSTVKGLLRTCFTSYPQVVSEVLGVMGRTDVTDIAALDTEIFKEGDIFLDAVLFAGDAKGHIMGSDAMAPHTKEHESASAYILLKVLPGVRFEFRFILSDGTLSAEEKVDLFSRLIRLFGLGSRTNAGFGRLKKASSAVPERRAEKMAPTGDEKVVCPHCGAENYQFYQENMTLRKKCFRCKNFLYSKEDWEGLR